MTHVVIGMGQIGSALQEILDCDYLDLNAQRLSSTSYDFVHICIPYSPEFGDEVRKYQKMFSPTYTVVHSTVPIGTCDLLYVTHSPCRGKHPSLKESMLTFTKYVGGIEAARVVDELISHGIPAVHGGTARDTEAGKLIDLMQLGSMVLLEKEIYRFCEENQLDYDTIYKDWNTTYNTGYAQLGQSHFTRPVYDHMEGKIGGHCVVQNMPSLHMPTAKRILEDNELL